MIETRRFELKDLNRKNVLIYMGQTDGTEDGMLSEKLDKAIRDFCKKVSGRACYLVTDHFETGSESLRKHLEGCEKVIVFAATAGPEADRLTWKACVQGPVYGLIYDALGTEAVEQICDRLCGELAETYGELTSRFSPGYGDLSIQVQKDILGMLDANRKIGISISDFMLMSPTKSVTAIVGIKVKREKT